MTEFTEYHNTFSDAWVAGLKAVLAAGERESSRNGSMIELLGWQFKVKNIEHPFLLNRRRAADPVYAAGEMLWFLSGESRIERILPYAPQYKRWADNGISHGSYGARWAENDQIYLAARLLTERPDTRQCVLTMWRASDLDHAVARDKKDLPCALTLQLVLRSGELHALASVRSQDIWLGLPYDVYTFCTVQRIVAELIGAKLGTYSHTAGSFHLYEKHELGAREAADANTRAMVPDKPAKPLGSADQLSRLVTQSLALQSNMHTANWVKSKSAEDLRSVCAMAGEDTLLEDLLLLVAAKDSHTGREHVLAGIHDANLREAFHYVDR